MSLTTARIPVRLTPLVGRDSELDDDRAGARPDPPGHPDRPGRHGQDPAGAGRREAGRAVFPAGVCWVELAPIEDPGLVGARRGQRAGRARHPRAGSVEAAAEYIAGHRLLVVLDNCEHLAEAAAALPSTCWRPARP